MTKRRSWLNKINTRIRTIEKNYGVEKSAITKLLEGIDGVFITEFGNVNVFEDFFTEETIKAVENYIVTAKTAERRAIEDAYGEDFMGPFTKKQIKAEVKGYYEFDAEIKDLVEKYYTYEFNGASTEEQRQFMEKLRTLGSIWHNNDPSKGVLLDLLHEAKKLII